MNALFDVRPGEARSKLIGFAVLLLLIIGAHTILETARDALLLSGPGPRALPLVYMAIAAATVPGAAVAARTGERFGQRRALGATLLLAVAGSLALFVLPSSHAAAVATYVLSGILGSVVVPQFWTLVGTALTIGQGRRLFGLISAAGVVGGVLGPAVASASLVFLPVKSLLLVSSGVFAVAFAALALTRGSGRIPMAAPAHRRSQLTGSAATFRKNPFLLRLALVVFLSTATFLALDYLFKTSVARSRSGAELAPFIAHYYLALNGASLVVQLLSGVAIRRVGILPALLSTPSLLLGGAALAFLTGGALPSVLFVKGIDGSMRYSIHRVTGELVYLPVPATARQRAKPLIDGGLARLAQTITGAGLLALGGTSLANPMPLAGIVAGLAAVWLVTVLTMRRPYLSLLRSAITSGSFGASDNLEPLDLETAQMLVQKLASEEPYEVEGAMVALSRRGRAGFVPALILLHADESVLLQALEMLGGSPRTDWFALGRRLLRDPRESVRVAAARALARHEQLDPGSLANDVGWRARGYAEVRMALRDTSSQIEARSGIALLLGEPGEHGEAARLGMLAAIADAPPTPALGPLLRALGAEPPGSRERTELLARAVSQQRDPLLVGNLVALLAGREGREAVRAALVAVGDAALDEVLRTLHDPTAPRRLRLHMPKTLARFADRRAADALLEDIETEEDGLVRYKAIRALRALVMDHGIFVDRVRTERLCCADLETHFRRLAAREVFDSLENDATGALLLGLLEDKASHALTRAFHLLQIAHPRQGIHRAYIACRSQDPFARANAVELLDALLRRADQRRLQELFRLAADELPRSQRVERARALVSGLPRSRDECWEQLAGGNDPIILALRERLRTPRTPRPLAPVIPLAAARRAR